MKLLMPLALFLPSLAFADCPTNHAYGFQYEYSNSSPVWNEQIVCGKVAVNLPAGIVRFSGGGGSGEISCSAGLSVSDIYQISGPASATAIPFTVRVHLTADMDGYFVDHPHLGHMCYGSSVRSYLNSGSQTDQVEASTNPDCTPNSISSDRTLALQKLPGEAFTINFGLSVSGLSPGSIQHALSFDGLPSGYTITSCQGYGSNPTPAAATSWGAVKATYR